MSDMLRITGMVSGMDTDATVKKLIKLEQTKVDKAKQDKQILEWQRDQYRDLASTLKTFQSDYFNLLKPQSNLMSASAFNAFSATSSSSAISATTSGASSKGKIEFSSISQLATADRYTSDSPVIGKLEGSANMAPIGDVLAKVQAGSNTLTFNLDGVSKTITLDPAAHNNYANTGDLIADINDKLASAYPSVAITASDNGGKLSIGVAESGHKLSISSAHADLLSDLKMTSGQSNVVDRDKTLAETFGMSGNIDLTINGVSDFGITADDSIDDVIGKINNSKAGVKLSYDQITDSFKMESEKTGVANQITMTDSSGLLANFKLTTHTAAQDAQFTMNTDNGPVVTSRSSNTFDVDGTSITLNATSLDPVTLEVKANTKDVKDKIVKFVAAYNDILDKLKSKETEKRYRNFAPLTDAQKKELDEDDEKKWQQKAQSGLLKSDYNLTSIAGRMRRALYETVEGTGISLKDMGITTSTDYREGGKLTIDEAALDKALEERPNDVIQLFTKTSDKAYLDKDHVSERYKESGLAQRLNDILNDNIRTTNGKGYLIRKAGRKDILDTSSDIYKKIKSSDDKIDKLLTMLAKKEENYYKQFGRMEAMLQKYNAQSNWLMNQFS